MNKKTAERKQSSNWDTVLIINCFCFVLTSRKRWKMENKTKQNKMYTTTKFV